MKIILAILFILFSQTTFAHTTTCTLSDGSTYTIQAKDAKNEADTENYVITGPQISETKVKSNIIFPLHLYQSTDGSVKIQFTDYPGFGLGILKVPGKPAQPAECSRQPVALVKTDSSTNESNSKEISEEDLKCQKTEYLHYGCR